MLPGFRLFKDTAPERAAWSDETNEEHEIAPESAMIRHATLSELYGFWSQKKAALGRLPARSDIAPKEIKALLPYIAIADVIDGGNDFRFRICGTAITEEAGAELTGQSWLSFPHTEVVVERTRELVETGTPYYAANVRARWAPKDFQHYSVLALPLAKDGTTVDMVLYGIAFHPMEAEG